MNIPKILAYLARPEGLGLHGPILETLGPKIFDIYNINKLASQGNLWATKILTEDQSSEYLWLHLLLNVMRNGQADHLKIILDVIDGKKIARKYGMFHNAIDESIDANHIKIIEILLNKGLIASCGPYSFLYRAINNNKIEITKMFIKNGSKEWMRYIDAVIYSNNIELIEFMIIEFPEILTKDNLSLCISRSVEREKPDIAKWFSDKLQSL